MSNIFGKDIVSYKHLNVLKKSGVLDAHMAAAKQANRPFLFDGALGAYQNKPLSDSEAAAGYGWLTNNLQAISTEIAETMYLDYRLPELVPINTSIPEGAESYAYRIKNKYGEAGFIDAYGTNAGSASVSYDILSAPILQGGIDGMWSLQEIRAAMFAGVPLAADTVQSATIACLNHIETVALKGDTSKKGFETGLINNKKVPVKEIKDITLPDVDGVKAINDAINNLIEDTNTIIAQRRMPGLTLYLPVKEFNYLATTQYYIGNAMHYVGKTQLAYLSENNAWTANTGMPLTVKTLLELKDSATTGKKKQRLMLAFNNTKVMEMAQPIAPRVIGIENKLRWFHAPLEYSLGALNFKLPKTCVYLDVN